VTNEINRLGEQVLNSYTDFHRCQLDIFKLMTTLCSGSILIVVAFVEKIFTHPEGTILVVLSLSGFIISLVGSVRMLSIIGKHFAVVTKCRSLFFEIEISKSEDINKLFEEKKEIDNNLDVLGKKADCYHRISNYAFLFGMLMLMSFAAVNLLTRPQMGRF